MVGQRSVLIVDPSEETREVLSTALGRRGHRTLAAAAAPQGLRLAREHHPDVIVLDLEIEMADGGRVSAPFVEQSSHDHSHLVLLGSVRRRDAAAGEIVTKPYHYGALIRKIEDLLGRGA